MILPGRRELLMTGENANMLTKLIRAFRVLIFASRMAGHFVPSFIFLLK